jgi:diadenosine tetraphosphate (Ap4A) HIT family hydrolase
MACLLCDGDQLEAWVIRVSPHWLTVVNRNQNLLGKLCIALRRHEESVAGLTSEEWADLREELRWAVNRLTRAFAPDHFNHAFLQNQDRHVHLHVIPRYAAPREFDGLRFDDPDYPGHYGLAHETIVGRGFAAALGAALQAQTSVPR